MSARSNTNPASPSTDFNLEKLVTEIRTLASQPDALASIGAYMEATFADADNVKNNMPEFTENESIIFEDDTVSIWQCSFNPGCTVPPHDHQMNAMIGIYTGVERNDFYTYDTENGIEHVGFSEAKAGQVVKLKPDSIHSVTGMSDSPSGGIHVYLGELTTVVRSLFDLEAGVALPFTEEAYDRLTR